MIKEFVFSDDGQALVDYSLIIALIVLVTVGTLFLFGRELLVLYENTEKKLADGLGGK